MNSKSPSGATPLPDGSRATLRQGLAGPTLRKALARPTLRRAIPARTPSLPAAGAVLLVSLILTTAVAVGHGTAAPASPETPAHTLQRPATLDVTLAVTVAVAQISGRGTADGRLSLTLETADGQVAATTTVLATAGRTWTASLRDSEGVPRGPWPGEMITVAGAQGARRVTVADASLRFDRVSGTVSGTTLPATPIDLAVGGGANARAQQGASDQHGAFLFEFGPGGTVRGREPVTLTLRAPANDLTTFTRLVPYAVVSLHPGDVSGAVRPGSPVRLDLLEGGKPTAVAQAVADEGGQFLAWLRDPAGNLARPHAGQTLRVRDADQEFLVPVADVTGSYDLDANLLLGTGVPGQELSLVVWNPYSPEYAEPSTLVGADGRWSLDPGIDIDPASHFYVTQHVPEGDEIFYCLQIPALHAQPGSPVIGVEALWDVIAQVTLERSGTPVADGAGAAAYEGWLTLTMRDGNGRPVAVMAGDRIEATVDGIPRSFEVLPLDARITPEGTLEGTASAGQSVVLSDRATIDTVTADQSGRFAFDVSEYSHKGWAQAGEAFDAYIRASSGDHVRIHFQGPTLAAQLDSARLTGSAMPASVFTVTRLGAVPSEQVTGTVGLDGDFGADLPSPAHAGDSLVLSTGRVSTTLPIPALSIAVDLTRGTIRGKGPAQTILGVDAYLGQSSFPARLFARTDEQGDWMLDLRAPDGGGAVTDPWRVTRFEVRHRDGANEVRLVAEGPALTARRAFLARLFRP